jgi:GTP-binding protein
LLLHIVDLAPPPGTEDPVTAAHAIVSELERFSPELAARERWLILNKIDLLGEGEGEEDSDGAGIGNEVVTALGWEGPVYRISALNKEGTRELVGDIMTRLEERQDKDSTSDSGSAADAI